MEIRNIVKRMYKKSGLLLSTKDEDELKLRTRFVGKRESLICECRQLIINEIVCTEDDYVSDLNTTITVFLFLKIDSNSHYDRCFCNRLKTK